jgi:hypothetical protein
MKLENAIEFAKGCVRGARAEGCGYRFEIEDAFGRYEIREEQLDGLLSHYGTEGRVAIIFTIRHGGYETEVKAHADQ